MYGNGPSLDKRIYEQSKKEVYMNDPTHSISAVNVKPIINNVMSYINYDNQRSSTNYTHNGNIVAIGNYLINYNDIPLTTNKELMIFNNNITNTVSKDKNNYILSNDMTKAWFIKGTELIPERLEEVPNIKVAKGEYFYRIPINLAKKIKL
jgi:hypothetical protein